MPRLLSGESLLGPSMLIEAFSLFTPLVFMPGISRALLPQSLEDTPPQPSLLFSL